MSHFDQIFGGISHFDKKESEMGRLRGFAADFQETPQ